MLAADRYHVVVGTDDDHCEAEVPLYGLTTDDRWANEHVGWACPHCGEQHFDHPITDPAYTPADWP